MDPPYFGESPIIDSSYVWGLELEVMIGQSMLREDIGGDSAGGDTVRRDATTKTRARARR